MRGTTSALCRDLHVFRAARGRRNRRAVGAHSLDVKFDRFADLLFRVPGAKSSLGFPGTVTRPGLLVCLNCRWLPRVDTWNQPSA